MADIASISISIKDVELIGPMLKDVAKAAYQEALRGKSLDDLNAVLDDIAANAMAKFGDACSA
jgi:hypothetical protein